MTLPIVFMFSGQGSQYFKMGLELYESEPRFRMWMDHCDEIAAPLIGRSLCDVLYCGGDKSIPFDRLLYTSPALLCFEYSLARVLMEAGAKPEYLLGYSLGEVTSAAVGGALTLEQAIQFVVDYAILVETQSPPASMLAIVNVPALESQYAAELEGCWISARNFDRHFVVTGPATLIECLRKAMLRDGVIHQLLPVRFGFHTEMVQPLERQVIELANRFDFQPLCTPCVSCYDGSTFEVGVQIDRWPLHLWSMFRRPVEFGTTVEAFLGKGDFLFLDVGPSGTLATFLKYLLPANSASVYGDVINPFGKDRHSYGTALARMGLAGATVHGQTKARN